MSVSEDAPYYVALFPPGIEDVVLEEVKMLAARLHIAVELPAHLPPKRLLDLCAGNEVVVDVCSTTDVAELHMPAATSHDDDECSITHLRGALRFRGGANVGERERLLDAVSRLRVVDRVAMPLWSSPCAHSMDEMNAAHYAAHSTIKSAVMEELQRLHTACAARARNSASSSCADGCMSGIAASLYGPMGDRAMLPTEVVFRVQAIRRDKSVVCSFSSPDLAAHVGELLAESFEDDGWRVSMLYFLVEFWIIHDEHTAHCMLSLSPPPLPRCGMETYITAQYEMELLRQRIGLHVQSDPTTTNTTRASSSPTPTTLASFKAMIPRAAAHRYELRRFKGDNAMIPALAAALVRYANIDANMIVVDPFVGSGSILMEAWLAVQSTSLMLVGMDLCAKDCVRTSANLLPAHFLSLAALHGVLPSSCTTVEMEELQRGWASCVRQRADAVPLEADAVKHCATSLMSGEPAREAEEIRLGNIFAHTLHNYHVCSMQGSAQHLPMRSNTVDRIISDLPFGRRCGNHNSNRKLYPPFLHECYRVLRSPPDDDVVVGDAPSSSSSSTAAEGAWWGKRSSRGGGRAVLLTMEGRLMLEILTSMRATHPLELVEQPFCVDMGGLFPYVFVLEKGRPNSSTASS